VQYLNVLKDRTLLSEMLKVSKGDRSVPVIVDGSKVQIGYGGA
jgi:glutaredoxin